MRIFLSSTYSDLVAHREAVYSVLRRMRYDVFAMEDYVASDVRPLKKYLRDVEESDLYIGIFAWRYGFIPSDDNPEGRSITELEYRKSVELKKPRLIFLLDNDAIWPPSKIDAFTGDGNRGNDIETFRKELTEKEVISFFRMPEELASLTATAVNNWERRIVSNLLLTPSRSETAIPEQPIKLFYSYAHEDEKHRNRLEKQLSNLKWQGLITSWHDRRIVAGQEWSKEIDEQINVADIILILISPDFLASEYCYGKEVKRLLERHEAGEAHVIPIILRPSDWEHTPFAALQVLPVDGRAVTKWQNRDEAFLDIAKGIRRAILELNF